MAFDPNKPCKTKNGTPVTLFPTRLANTEYCLAGILHLSQNPLDPLASPDEDDDEDDEPAADTVDSWREDGRWSTWGEGEHDLVNVEE